MLNLTRVFLLILLLISHNVFSQTTAGPTQQKFNQTLHDQLPDDIKQAKQINAVNDGDVPPYVIYSENSELSGLTIDLFNAISQILGVRLQHARTTSVAAMLLGVQSGRYDLAIAPVVDWPDRQASNDFIAYAISYAAIIVPKDNPYNIQSDADICGHRLAGVGGARSVEVLTGYSNECVTAGKAPLDIMVFKDQSSALLAVKSGRADALMGGISILSYYAAKDKESLTLVGVRNMPDVSDNSIRYHAAVVGKNSPLSPVIVAALQELIDNGTYANIMKKWHMEAAMLDKPGINLAK